MFGRATRSCAVLMLGVVFPWQLSAASQGISIVEQSQAKAIIVVGASPTPDELSAANELSYYIGKATGATLRMHAATSADGSPGARIYRGAVVLPPAMQAKLGTLKADGYLVDVSGDAVFLGGVKQLEIAREPAFLWRDLGPLDAL